MKRPFLVHFIAVDNGETVAIRASLALRREENDLSTRAGEVLEQLVPSIPLQNLGLMGRHDFSLRIIGRSESGKCIFDKQYESDRFGDFDIRFPSLRQGERIRSLQVYETGHLQGLELVIGNLIPWRMDRPSKIVVSDLDNTLVETQHTMPWHLINSLRRPIGHFPPIYGSIERLKSFIDEGFHPFILTASPHFFGPSVHDWLAQHRIFPVGVFLKDYRKVFSFSDTTLAPKDLTTQGFYKLNHLINILLMTGIPEELVLMGDEFEADAVIYLTLAAMLRGEMKPRTVWNAIQKEQEFKLTMSQNMRFLSKFYHLETILGAQGERRSTIRVLIRCRKKIREASIRLQFLKREKECLSYFVA